MGSLATEGLQLSTQSLFPSSGDQETRIAGLAGVRQEMVIGLATISNGDA